MQTIEGDSAIKLLSDIMKAKYQITLSLPGIDYTRLTMIVGVYTVKGKHFIALDYIRDFTDILRANGNPDIVFEFQDLQKVKCRFITKLFKVLEQDQQILIHAPHKISRIQRRQHVRVAVPSGSKLNLNVQGVKLTTSIKDISLGGLSATAPANGHVATLLNEGDKVENIRIQLVLKDELHRLDIRSAVLRRIQSDQKANVRSFGFQFLSMDAKSEKALSNYIIQLERYLLRKAKGYSDDY